MLTEVASGVWVRQSELFQSNAVIVRGERGVLLVDPGIDGDDLAELADDIAGLGETVVAGFSTHPHWDHVLCHARFGEVPRYGTAQGAKVARERIDDARDKAARFAGVPLDLVGALTPLPAATQYLSWSGPAVRIIEHRAHAPGHAALLIEHGGVLVAGDMLSDIEIPLLDLSSADPQGDYLAALDMFDGAVADVAVVVPGHGSIGLGAEVGRRIDVDRGYVDALREGRDPADPRVGPLATYGRDWLPDEHRRQMEHALR